MDSPKRKQLRRNDYLRHKMFRKIRKRQKAELEQQKKAAEKELKRRLRVTPLPKFDKGLTPKDEYEVMAPEQWVVAKQRERAKILYDSLTGKYSLAGTGEVVTPLNRLVEDDPSTWTFVDENGRRFDPHNSVFNNNPGEIRLAEEAPFLSNNYIKQAAHNYMSELAYDINNNRVVGGKYTMPAIATVAAAPFLVNAYGNAAINSAFAAHGLNHAVNEGVDGLGDAAMTTLEMLPLYQMSSKLIPNLFGNAQRYIKQFPYRLQIPVDPEKYYRIVSGDGAILDANRSGMITRPYVTRQSAEFPYFTKGMLYNDVNKSFDLSNPRVIVSKPNLNFIKVRDGLDEIDKTSSIAIGDSATPIVRTRYGTAYNSAPAENFEYYTKGNGFLSKYFWKKRQFTPFADSYKINPEMLGRIIDEGSEASVYETLGNPHTVTKVYDGWAKNINPFDVRDIITTRNSVPGAMTSKIKGFTENGYPVVEQGRVVVGGDGSKPFTKEQIEDLESLLKSNDYGIGEGVEIDVPTKNGMQIRDLSPKNIGYDYNGNLRIIDPDVDVVSPDKVVHSDIITAENAASMTPEQWTAAQDAAIARGDMAEAQRLRDLHFKVSAPSSHVSKGVYLPSGKQPTLSQADYYNGDTDLVTLYHSSVDADNLIKEGFDGIEHGLGRTKGEPKGTIFASANQDYAADYSNLYVQEGYSTPDKVGLMELKVPRGAGVYEGNEVRLRPEHIKEITKSAYEKTPWLKWLKTRKTDKSLYNIKSADAVTYDNNGVRIPLGERDNFNIKDIRYDINDPDFESFTIPTEELQRSLNAPINNPVVINGKEYPTMKALMNKVEMVKPDELNAAHLLAQKEIRMYLESPEYRLRLIDNGFDPDKYISALEHYLGSRVKYGELNSGTNGVTEIVDGEPEITLNNSVFDTDYDTLIHELAHALTKNLDHSMYVKDFIDTRLKDIMLYNEKILPQLDRDVVAQSGVSIDRLTYLNDPLEIRARMISIIMDARRKGVKLSEYIDKVKSNRLLNDLKSFLNVEDIKKYGANILGVTPFAIPFAKNNKHEQQSR